ncbi:hypothetical protein KFU94_12755 [Chloroflexi bacterium TSY]|nr:hypothetical protein [Chloroflexi bacterium TSY]
MDTTVVQNNKIDFVDRWQRHIVGMGKVTSQNGILCLSKACSSQDTYSNAQIDDYQGLPRNRFRWHPPLQLTVHARFSHSAAQTKPTLRSVSYPCISNQLTGTAGFGFWNDPFLMTNVRWPTLPRAIWFFHASPPSNMKLCFKSPGYGWKAATIDAWRLPFWLLLPTAPIAMPLMRIDWFYRWLWPIGQRAIAVREASIPHEMTKWHTYTLEWHVHLVRFLIDGNEILTEPVTISGPLGFVAWIDNQYMIVTPQGKFGHGMVESQKREFLELAQVQIEPL